MSHTPGPWKLETVSTSVGSCHKIGPFPSNGVYGETHTCIYSDNVRVGETGNTIGNELLANARLIAAAPELLEALKSMVSAFHPTQGGSNIYCDAATDMARAAIARAEGGG